ncbi:MAG: hypothetical protein HFJ41_06875 [Clostridia bacterium]|nr:hypothetical protein [Clostridia bacterium]
MKSKEYKFKEFAAITLISLVITIIILIILSSIAIYLSLGNNGIFTRAKQAKEVTNKQEATEIINLKITTAQMNKYSEEQRMPTLKELSLSLGMDKEIQYVTEQSKKKASTEYNVTSEKPSSIYTKLKEYPYEFEINSMLQLASIDGIKIAQNTNNIIDYADSNNEVILSKKVEVTAKNSNWFNIYVEGPEIEAGTWLIFIDIEDKEDTSAHNTIILGTGCSSNSVTNVWAGTNHTNGYYKGEKTKLKANIFNDSTKTRNYTITFKALKLSNTY